LKKNTGDAQREYTVCRRTLDQMNSIPNISRCAEVNTIWPSATATRTKYLDCTSLRLEEVTAISIAVVLQGYIAHKKPPPPRTLQWDHA